MSGFGRSDRACRDHFRSNLFAFELFASVVREDELVNTLKPLLICRRPGGHWLWSLRPHQQRRRCASARGMPPAGIRRPRVQLPDSTRRACCPAGCRAGPVLAGDRAGGSAACAALRRRANAPPAWPSTMRRRFSSPPRPRRIIRTAVWRSDSDPPYRRRPRCPAMPRSQSQRSHAALPRDQSVRQPQQPDAAPAQPLVRTASRRRWLPLPSAASVPDRYRAADMRQRAAGATAARPADAAATGQPAARRPAAAGRWKLCRRDGRGPSRTGSRPDGVGARSSFRAGTTIRDLRRPSSNNSTNCWTRWPAPWSIRRSTCSSRPTKCSRASGWKTSASATTCPGNCWPRSTASTIRKTCGRASG